MATPGCAVVVFDEVNDQDAVEIDAMLVLEVSALQVWAVVSHQAKLDASCRPPERCLQRGIAVRGHLISSGPPLPLETWEEPSSDAGIRT